MISEIRLPRATNALAQLQQKLPPKARVLRVRYTGAELVAIYLP